MSRWNRPLTCREVKTILKALGFSFRNQEGSHENWVRDQPPPFRKVTVDCPKAPFSQDMITFIARQAGMKKKEFIEALDD